jgi:hypothetical protein
VRYALIQSAIRRWGKSAGQLALRVWQEIKPIVRDVAAQVAREIVDVLFQQRPSRPAPAGYRMSSVDY